MAALVEAWERAVAKEGGREVMEPAVARAKEMEGSVVKKVLAVKETEAARAVEELAEAPKPTE